MSILRYPLIISHFHNFHTCVFIFNLRFPLDFEINNNLSFTFIYRNSNTRSFKFSNYFKVRFYSDDFAKCNIFDLSLFWRSYYVNCVGISWSALNLKSIWFQVHLHHLLTNTNSIHVIKMYMRNESMLQQWLHFMRTFKEICITKIETPPNKHTIYEKLHV